jgi:hypothetical protein
MTAVETAQAALDAAQHAANLADPKFHRAQLALREQALQDALEAEADAAQTRRLTLHGATGAHTEALDAAVTALQAYVEAREQLVPVREAYDAARRASLAAGDPVEAPDTFEQRRVKGAPNRFSILWDRAQAARGRW